MEVERNLVVILPTGSSGKRPSITSSRFEIRKASDPTNKIDSAQVQGSKLCFRMADLVTTMLIVFPLSIGVWRGIWGLVDIYCEECGDTCNPWVIMVLGYLIPFLLYLFQEPLKRHVVPGKMNFISFYIISRCLLIVHSFGCINQWRGLWNLMDVQLGMDDVKELCATLLFGTFFNLILCTFSNVLAPPLLCFVDEAYTIHDCPLRFKTPPTQKFAYFFDCLFSVCVIPTLTVFQWRGLWHLADVYLYPDDPNMSTIISLAFGYSVCIILCALQPLICEVVCSLTGLARLAFLDMTYMVGFVGCVIAWRGVWNAYDTLLIFETPTLSEWVSTLVGTIVLVFLGSVSTVIVRGIAIDGEIEEDEAAEWLIPYISHLRNRVTDVPFPEPWIFRYLCTSQKMNCDKVSRPRSKRRVTSGRSDQIDGSAQPLKNINNVQNSINVISPEEDEIRMGKNHLKMHLSHIDSSSEEDLGTRKRMDANTEIKLSVLENEPRLEEVVTKKLNQDDKFPI